MIDYNDFDSLFVVYLMRLGLLDEEKIDQELNQWKANSETSFGSHLYDQGLISAIELESTAALAKAQFDQSVDSPKETFDSIARQSSGTPSPKMLAAIFNTLGGSDETEDIEADVDQPTELEDEWVTIKQKSSAKLPIKRSSSRFEIIEEHARGGLGEVFRANDLELNREVALKKIQAQYADDLSLRQRFVIEAELTGGLEHPGIVPVYGLGHSENGQPYYAMRFIHGKSFSATIEDFYKQHGVSWNSDASIEFRNLLGKFVDVCYTMHYAHSRGVLHRDIKPDNIMLGEFGETLIVDWGIAKVIGRKQEQVLDAGQTINVASGSNANQTRQGNLIGTPGFMSPTQSMGWHDSLDARDDVYSLGATLFCLVTGERPFQGSSVDAIIEQVVQGALPTPRSINKLVDPPINAICKKAMATKSADRYSSAKALAKDVEAYLADEPVSAWAEPVSVRIRRWFRKHRTFAIAVATTLLVLTAGSIIASILLAAANRRETEAKLLAQTNFERTRDVVDEFFTDVSESAELLKGTPGTQELRQKLLRKARAYYEDFLNKNRDSQSMNELAEANLRLANISRELGDHSMAIEGYLQTIEYLQDTEQSAAVTSELGRAHLSLCREYFLTGSVDHSVTEGKTSVAIFDKLLTEIELENGDEEFVAVTEFSKAQSHHQLAKSLAAGGQKEEAKTEFKSAETILLALFENDRSRPELLSELVDTKTALAEFESDKGKIDETVNIRLEAIKLLEQSLESVPDQYDQLEILGKQKLALAGEYILLKRTEEAAVLVSEARSVFDRLVDGNPAIPRYQYELNRGSRVMLRLAEDTSEFEQVALDVLKQAQRISDGSPENISFKIQCCASAGDLAAIQLSLGKHEEAAVLLKSAIEIGDEVLPLVTSTFSSEMAEGLERLANVYSDFEEHAKSIELFEKATLLREKLHSNHPDSLIHTANLSKVLLNTSYAYATAADAEESLAFAEKSLPLAKTVAEKLPNVPEYQDNLITVYLQSANLLVFLDDSERAVEAFKKSRSLAIAAEDSFPNYGDGLFIQRAALANWIMGNHFHESGDFKSAIDVLREAVTSFEQLVGKFPKDENSQATLGNVLQSLSASLYADDRFDDAETEISKAISLFESMSNNKNKLTATHYLAGSLSTSGEFALDQDRFAFAIERFEAADKLYSDVLETVSDNAMVQTSVEQMKPFYAEAIKGYVRQQLLGDKPYDSTSLIDYALKACELTENNDWEYTQLMALVYADAEDHGNAEKWIKTTLDLVPAERKTEVENQFDSIRNKL